MSAGGRDVLYERQRTDIRKRVYSHRSSLHTLGTAPPGTFGFTEQTASSPRADVSRQRRGALPMRHGSPAPTLLPENSFRPNRWRLHH